MKIKTDLFVRSLPVFIVLLACGGVFAQRPAILNKAALPDVQTVSRMQTDDVTQATGLPRADIAIQDMCFQENKGGLNSVNVLLANIGTVDAGPFQLGFNYISADGSSRFALDKISGLKAGEQQWVYNFHVCCGFVPSMILVDWAARYEAIADPKYYKQGDLPYTGSWVKGVVPESNEGNNKMSRSKRELRSCSTIKSVTTPVPAIKPIRP